MAKYFQKSEPAVDEVVDTSNDIALGASLLGTPAYFDDVVGARLMEQGLAAKTDEGWVRGFKWHSVYGG